MSQIGQSVRVWADMVKIAHSVFALPFALVAVFLAARSDPALGTPRFGHLVLVVICMVAARSVAMTFNRIVDAQIDARNPRTATRPLPAGKLSMGAAWGMLLLSAVTFGLGCIGFYFWFGNAWPLLLSGPVLLYLCGYSFTKRFTRFSHFYLGSAIGLSPLAAWIAVAPQTLGVEVVLLMVAVMCWIGGFDIIYACQDVEIDRREELFSLPSRIGPARALWVARAAHLVVVGCLVALGIVADLGIVYAIGVALAAGLLIVENALVRADDLSRVNLAFFTINGVVSVAFAASAIGDILLRASAA